MKSKLLFFLIYAAAISTTFCQTIPLGFPVLNEYLRREQVLGNINSSFSFNYRPVMVEKAFPEIKSVFIVDSTDGYQKKLLLHNVDSKKFRATVLPLSLYNAYNTNRPYNWGQGPILPARGFQTVISGGVHLKWGVLSVQLQPQYHYAQNLDFEEYPEDAPTPYYEFLRRSQNYIDSPVRFGDSPVSRLLPGNSHFLLNLGNISTGISTENIWWGPGKRNALLLGFNSEGFLHYTLRTSHPLKTFLGNFEGEYFIGKLDNSNLPYYSDSNKINILRSKQRDDWRYFTGLSVTYNPKWVNNLFIGIGRTFQKYIDDMDNDIISYFPLFADFQKEGALMENHNARQDQHVEVFARYLVPKANVEFYFEFMRNDHPYNWRELTMNPEHSRGYTIGFSKIIPGIKSSYMIDLEATQTQASINNIIRWPGLPNGGLGLYDNFQVQHGLTQKGENLGSSTGISGNVAAISITKFNKFNSIGFSLERFERDKNFYQYASTNGLAMRPWIDYSIGINVSKSISNLLISGTATSILSKNHLYNMHYNPDFPKNTNSFNQNFSLNVAYLF